MVPMKMPVSQVQGQSSAWEQVGRLREKEKELGLVQMRAKNLPASPCYTTAGMG